MGTFVPGEGIANHPFGSALERGESLLWIGRPDQPVYVRRGWQQFRAGIGLWCLLVASSAFAGFVYPANRFDEFACVFFLILLPLLFWMGVCYFKESYYYAPWYALTDRRVLAATPGDGDFVVHKTGLSNVTDVSVQGAQAGVGTVRCRCYYSVPTLLSKNLRLENVSDPESIRGLILEAKHRASEGQPSA